jgi:hypothetical protein
MKASWKKIVKATEQSAEKIIGYVQPTSLQVQITKSGMDNLSGA